MAAVTAGVVVAAGSAYAANRQGAAQKKAGRAQASAAQQTLDQQRTLYDQASGQALPFYEAGTNALAQLDAVNSGDYSGFNQSPDYLFALQQGQQGVERSAAARGGLYSGGNLADLTTFGQGLASQQLGNYRNNLMQLANMGQNQSQYLGQLGQNYGNQFGNAMGIKGQANAQVASAGPMTQAGYGNALAAGASAYAGAAGGGGGGFSSFMGGGGGGGGQGSMVGFGNNVNSLINMPGGGYGRNSSFNFQGWPNG